MVVSTFTLAGDVSSFDAAAQAKFKAGYAAWVGSGVPASSVILSIEPASIKVTATAAVIDAATATAASNSLQALTTAELTSSFGTTVQSVNSIGTATRAYEAPSPPPPINPVPSSPLPPRSPSPVSPPPMPPQAPPYQFPVLAVALGAGIPGGILILCCLVFVVWKVRKARQPVIVKTVSSTDVEVGIDKPEEAPAPAQPIVALMSQESELEKLDDEAARKTKVMGPSVSFQQSASAPAGEGPPVPPPDLGAASNSGLNRSRTVRKIHTRLQYEQGEHIGAELQLDHKGKLVVDTVQPGSIAENFGLTVGSALVEANGVSVRGIGAGAVAQHLRAQTGTRYLVFSKSINEPADLTI